MSDFALEWNQTTGGASVVVEANDLKPDDGLRTAILLSLFLDAPAQRGDRLPDGSTAVGGERGWWADALPVVPGDKVGSRLWLLERTTESAENLTQVVRYASESIDWMKVDAVTQRVDVAAEYMQPAGTGLVMTVTVYRPDGTVVRHRFDRTWAAEAARI